MTLQKILSNHLPSCAIETYNGSTTCTCGIETARAELEVMQTELAEEKARNELFSDCLRRALALFRNSYPETSHFIDGADNFVWLFEQIKKAEEISKLDCHHLTSIFLDEKNGVQRHKCTWECGLEYHTITVGVTTYEVK